MYHMKFTMTMQSGAQHIGVSEEHLRVLIANGQVRATQDGQVDLMDLEEYKKNKLLERQETVRIHTVAFTQPVTEAQSLDLIRSNVTDLHISWSAMGLLAMLHACAHLGSGAAHPVIRAGSGDLGELETLMYVRITQEEGRTAATLLRL